MEEGTAASEGPPIASGSKLAVAEVEEASEEKAGDEGEDGVPSQEEEERAKIWDVFAEEYHDSKPVLPVLWVAREEMKADQRFVVLLGTLVVTELPLEYHRNFTLLTELEESQQSKVHSVASTPSRGLTPIRSQTRPTPSNPLSRTT